MNEALELAVGNRVSLESAQSKPPAGKASAISKSAPSDGRYRRATSGDSRLTSRWTGKQYGVREDLSTIGGAKGISR